MRDSNGNDTKSLIRIFAGACRQSVDLAFLVDGSADKANFGKFIDFVEAITKKLSVSEYGTRVALLTFADKGELKFGFDK